MLTTEVLSDWAVVADYLNSRTSGFIDPCKFNTLRSRGLVWVINDLGPDGPRDLAPAMATAYARLRKVGKVYGDDEIDEISHHLKSISGIQQAIGQADAGDFVKLMGLNERLGAHLVEVAEYFRRQK